MKKFFSRAAEKVALFFFRKQREQLDRIERKVEYLIDAQEQAGYELAEIKRVSRQTHRMCLEEVKLHERERNSRKP